MKLLFIEPDALFFRWLTNALEGHECDRAETVESASGRGFDAVFLDVSAFPNAGAVAAQARMMFPQTPLIILTGKEVRTDLLKICDGLLVKGMLETDPARIIPNAVAAIQKKKKSAHRIEETTQLFNALACMRRAAA